MSESRAVSATDARRPIETGLPGLGQVVIGKDVLELVSSAMYIDPMTVYRGIHPKCGRCRRRSPRHGNTL